MNGRLRRLGRADRLCLIAVLATGIVLSLISNSRPFRGLEYEDAYEYTYSGLLLNYQPETRTSGLNSVCVEGSVLRCRRFMTLSHPIGLSVLISACAAIIGMSREYGRYISCASYLTSALAAYLLARIWRKSRLYGFSASFLFLFTPDVFAFSETGLSEPASALLIVLTLLFSSELVLRDFQGPSRIEELNSGIGLVFVLITAVFVRRENLILCVANPHCSVWLGLCSAERLKSRT